ncbi:MAG TPA: ComF family protein [Burkholderiales bacterium]
MIGRDFLRSRLERAIDWLLPSECALCGAAIASRADLCDGCERSLPRLDGCCSRCAVPLEVAAPDALCGQCQQQLPPYDSVHAPFRYAPPLDRLVQGAKYHGRLDWLQLLGRRLARHVASRRGDVDAAVAVPLHPTRLRERGYNQSVELLRVLGAELNLAARAPLERVRATPPQAQLSSAARRRNVRGAFVSMARLEGLRLALVDDVMTSGATVEEATQCLLDAGAASVEVWVVARA